MVSYKVFSGPTGDHYSSPREKLYSIAFIRYSKTLFSCPHGVLADAEGEAWIPKVTVVFQLVL